MVVTMVCIYTGFPGLVGILDGKHWYTESGAEDMLAYRCYKGGRSINMLGMCDHRYKFRWVSNFFPGNTADARMYFYSSLKRKLTAGTWPPKVGGEVINFTLSVGGDIVRIPIQIAVDGGFAATEHFSKPYPASVARSPLTCVYDGVQVYLKGTQAHQTRFYV